MFTYSRKRFCTLNFSFISDHAGCGQKSCLWHLATTKNPYLVYAKRNISDISPKTVFLPFNNKQTTHNTYKNLLTLFLTTQKDGKMWPGAHSVIHLWTELCIISIAMEQENIVS